jgi:hypothetical protein
MSNKKDTKKLRSNEQAIYEMKTRGMEKGEMWELTAWIGFILIILFMVNPSVRTVPSSLIFYAIQGAIFVFSFFASTLLAKRLFPNSSIGHSILIFIFVGLFCGLLSSIPNIGISWLGGSETFKLTDALDPYGIENQIKTELITYGICSSIIGAFLGAWVAYRKK